VPVGGVGHHKDHGLDPAAFDQPLGDYRRIESRHVASTEPHHVGGSEAVKEVQHGVPGWCVVVVGRRQVDADGSIRRITEQVALQGTAMDGYLVHPPLLGEDRRTERDREK